MIHSFDSCLHKQEKIKQIFENCHSPDEKYEQILKMGKELKNFDEKEKTEENLVKGCQSQMFLSTSVKEGKMHFKAYSDALISSGLAYLLLQVYDNEPPEVVLKCPPDYLQELGIFASLSPGRANGLASLHLRMKQEALKAFMQTQSP